MERDARMRSPGEFMQIVLGFAEADARIRLVGMEGSRVNGNIPKDEFQDFDITYFVDRIGDFTQRDDWLSAFGEVVMLQKPEDMELFPPEEMGYSYLMLFSDGVKMDLTLLEKRHLPAYLAADGLRTILLDKDGDVPQPPVPNDLDYHLKKPSARSFDDCCNEFWNLGIYVAKGICRGELLYAADHLQMMRSELLRMLAWQVGQRCGYTFSVGKHYKFLPQYLTDGTRAALYSTYRMDSAEALWQALETCQRLFREASGALAEAFGYAYPPYDRSITAYTERCRARFAPKT